MTEVLNRAIVQNCDRAFSSPRSQFFPIRTDPKPANNIFIFFFLAVNWLTTAFVYATLYGGPVVPLLHTLKQAAY